MTGPDPAFLSPDILLTVVAGAKRELISARRGDSLIDALRRRQLYINSPCGGAGTCGKCRITILAGRLETTVSDTEPQRTALVGETALACRSRLLEDCAIDIGLLAEKDFLGNTEFTLSTASFADTGLETIRFSPAPGVWNTGGSIAEIISEGVGRQLSFTPESLRQLSFWMGESLRQDFSGPGINRPVLLTLRDDRVLLVRTSEAAPVYGIGVDIGTTTVAFSLVDLENGAVQRTFSLLNSQRQYGADVVARIQKGTEGCAEALRDCIRTDLSRGITELCGDQNLSVASMVIAGNTTMLHLLLGLRADSLALFPFNPVTMAAMNIPSAELIGFTPVRCETVLLPSVGAYMGADIMAGLMYCGLDQSVGVSLFIDVGTNGEMAIAGRNSILCVSTAAGPAFEGANITWGTGSVPGAISTFDFCDGAAHFQTIGGAPPIGICGSAVIDLVAACLRTGLVDRTGRFISDETGQEGLPITQNPSGEWIRFTQKDFREFQLAKSAIRSGLEILIREYGCSWDEVGQVYLAGGFGTRINAANAVEVGLFPGGFQEKIQAVGNSSLGGTVHYLLYKDRRTAVEHIVKSTTVLDLSRHSAFNDLFMEHLSF